MNNKFKLGDKVYFKNRRYEYGIIDFICPCGCGSITINCYSGDIQVNSIPEIASSENLLKIPVCRSHPLTTIFK